MKKLKFIFKWAFISLSIPAAMYLLMGYVAETYDLSKWTNRAILLLGFLSFGWLVITLFFELFKEMLKEGEE